MPEAVIVDSVRTPIGRAFKGSLKDLRPDETAAFILDALLERNEGLDPKLVEDVYMGCGLPQGMQANNIIAGHGDVYIAGGVEFVSRFTEAQEAARPQDQNENLQGNDGQTDAYIAMGQTAENVA